MKMRTFGWRTLIVCALLAPVPSWADLYSAVAAMEKKEFEKAFESYRELAELGHPEAQENLAVMYVNGEGVKRDNVLGYAWAVLSLENGGGEAAKSIVAQLEPHMNAAARSRVAEVRARFGKATLDQRLPPIPAGPGAPNANSCRMRSVANPDHFYPPEAKARKISGTVLVEATVAPDGRARNPRVWYSLPPDAFDAAGRGLAMHNQYTPIQVNGVAVACTIRFKVRFSLDRRFTTDEFKNSLVEAKAKAESGDPRAQLTYGLLLEMRADMNTEKEVPLSWFIKAAQAGLPTAQYLVGMHALSGVGQGNEKDGSVRMFWLQRAADAGQVDAQALLANYLLLRKPDAGALAKARDLLEKAAASGNRDGKFLLAALLATAADTASRDPKRSLELLPQIKSELDFDPAFFEARAAAQAMLGNFAEAQADQNTALRMAKKLGWDLAKQQARLTSYTESKPWTGNLFEY